MAKGLLSIRGAMLAAAYALTLFASILVILIGLAYLFAGKIPAGAAMVAVGSLFGRFSLTIHRAIARLAI